MKVSGAIQRSPETAASEHCENSVVLEDLPRYGSSTRVVAGCAQRARSRDARILSHVLLVQHNCVESLHLDDVLLEGGGLDEYRELVLSALRENQILQTLSLCSRYEYK
ncbi:hypothetical protein MTO96_017595 [Rhipicephalus appendiculatus]